MKNKICNKKPRSRDARQRWKDVGKREQQSSGRIGSSLKRYLESKKRKVKGSVRKK